MDENKRYELKCHEINSWYIEKDGKVIIFDLFKSDAEILYAELNNLSDENEQLKQQVEDLYESDKSLRKFASNMTLNYTGICVPRRLFDEVLNILKDMEHNDLVEDLSKESIDTSANGCQK